MRTDAHHAQGCNMSFRKDVAIKLGGFDKRFGGSAHLEETDFCVRLIKGGYRMVFDPTAELIHLKDAAGGCRTPNWNRWFYWYGHNHALLFFKNTRHPHALLILKGIHMLLSALKRKEPSLFLKALDGMRNGIRTFKVETSTINALWKSTHEISVNHQ
jgi:GT2 family glycosyltransferase